MNFLLKPFIYAILSGYNAYMAFNITTERGIVISCILILGISILQLIVSVRMTPYHL